MPTPRDYRDWTPRPALKIYQGYFRIGGRIVKRKLASFAELEMDDSGAPRNNNKSAIQRRARLLSQRYDAIQAELELVTAARGSRSILAVMQDWIDAAKGVRAAATIDLYIRVSNDYIRVIGDHPLAEITGVFINRFSAQIGRRISRNTVRLELSVLRAFLNWAVESSDLESVPKFRMPVPEKKLPRVLSDSDVEKLDVLLSVLRRYGPDRYRRSYQLQHRAFRVLLDTGARESEVYHLRWSDIDLMAPSITFRFSKNFRIKEGREKMLPLTPRLAAFLEAERDAAPSEVFLLDGGIRDGVPVLAFFGPKALAQSMRNHMDTLKIGAGVKPIHGLRALFAHRLREKNVDIYTIKNLLGHRQVATTEGYFPDQKGPEKAAIALLGL